MKSSLLSIVFYVNVSQKLVVEEQVEKYLDRNQEDTGRSQSDLGWWNAAGVLGDAQGLDKSI